MTDVIVLRLLAELAHAHVFDHAGAQRADGRLVETVFAVDRDAHASFPYKLIR